MTSQPFFLGDATGRLLAVPAIHFDHVFAYKVNQLCHGFSAPPDAIAVELGSGLAHTAKKWLMELGVGPLQKKPLPVMLGVLRGTRLFPCSLKDKDFELQPEEGIDLSEPFPDVLQRERGLSGKELLCLSPTDSIVEAIRCGIELNIPVYGIDLEDSTAGVHRVWVIEDSLGARQDFDSYVHRNAPFAAGCRDENIDRKREIAMAACLKTLLKRHRMILFTCGMAHWESIKRLLEDDTIKPALCPDASAAPSDDFKRVLVHPLLAAACLDRFPAIAECYEAWRNGCGEVAEPAELFENCLKTVYLEYFASELPSSLNRIRGTDVEGLDQFAAYLNNLNFLHFKTVPTLSLLATAAGETMSRDFCAAAVNAFMKLPWASAKAFPELPVLRPTTKQENGITGMVFLEEEHGRSEPFHVKSIHGEYDHLGPAEIPYRVQSENRSVRAVNYAGSQHTWLPWDYLNASLCIRAMRAAKLGKPEYRARSSSNGYVPVHGIDIKATIRSFGRGERRLYVREAVKVKSRHARFRFTDGFPVVWLLDPEAGSNVSDWIVLWEPLVLMAPHVHDQQALEKIASEQGSKMVSTIGYGTRGARKEAGTVTVRCYKYAGQIVFQPPFCCHQQYAAWAETTSYGRNPFCELGGLLSSDACRLAEYYHRKHGIRLDEQHWTSTLILFALPFAKRDLIVVAPVGYRLEKSFLRLARKYRVMVKRVTLNQFSTSELDRISRCHMVSVIQHEPHCVYHEKAEEIIGESQTAYRDLVPRHWLDFGMGNNGG